MFSSLDASNFSGSISFYDLEFESILSKIVICYKLMRKDNVALNNDENKIRDVLVNKYINNPKVKEKIQLKYFLFPEVPETETIGRTDIRIHNPNRYYNQEEYFIIECKRLDSTNMSGITGLNAKYIENGIQRFATKHYSSYYRVNGMIGFVVEKIDIHANINSINNILTSSFNTITTKKEITHDSFIENFDFQYHSIHFDNDNSEFKLYHLMFDFHENIQN